MDLPDERQLICDVNANYSKGNMAEREHFTYWILGEWQRGMQYPTTQNGGNWERRVSELAASIHHAQGGAKR